MRHEGVCLRQPSSSPGGQGGLPRGRHARAKSIVGQVDKKGRLFPAEQLASAKATDIKAQNILIQWLERHHAAQELGLDSLDKKELKVISSMF